MVSALLALQAPGSNTLFLRFLITFLPKLLTFLPTEIQKFWMSNTTARFERELPRPLTFVFTFVCFCFNLTKPRWRPSVKEFWLPKRNNCVFPQCIPMSFTQVLRPCAVLSQIRLAKFADNSQEVASKRKWPFHLYSASISTSFLHLCLLLQPHSATLAANSQEILDTKHNCTILHRTPRSSRNLLTFLRIFDSASQGHINFLELKEANEIQSRTANLWPTI